MGKAGVRVLSKEACVKVYILGQMRGLPEEVWRKSFNDAADKLRRDGHEVMNPAAANLERWNDRQIFKYLLSWICDEAEAFAALPGFSMSEGASSEYFLAKRLGLKRIQL